MEGLFDSHTHLQLRAFARDRQAAFDRAREAGVAEMVVVGIDGTGSREAVALAAREDGVYAAIGFHPHEARLVDGEALRLLRELSADPQVVALGEIGLDFYRNLSPREAQARAFREQLDLASELGLPVIIHSREAAAETYAVLRDWLAEGPRPEEPVGVLHCFSGDLAAAQRYVEMGFMISVAGNVTYPNAARLQAVADALPLEHLIVETDCPFLAPQSHRGRRCEPSYLTETVDRIAALRNINWPEVAAATRENARRLYRLTGSPGERA